MFGSDLQGPADHLGRVSFAAAVSEGVLLDLATDFVSHGRFEFDDVESIQDGHASGNSALIALA